MRIALVDDNRDDLQTLHRCLTENLISDCDIVEFTGGDEFLKSFTDNSYDLIVLDIYMGEFTGIDVAREIRKRDSHVLIAFGTTSNEFAAESYEVNACYYLKKPFDREHVLIIRSLSCHARFFFRTEKKYFCEASCTQTTHRTA